MWIVARVRAVRAFRLITTPNDLLRTFRVEGIRFGDVIYDQVLAGGYATVDRIDERTLRVLERFFYLRSLVKYAMRKYDIRAGVFSHMIGIEGATFSRYLLQNRIEVLTRIGSHQILVTKYRDLGDVGIYPVTPERRYFDAMIRNDDGTIINRAEQYLESRFGQEVQHLAVALAFDRRKCSFSNSEAFCEAYGLDPAKPIVFVMLHAFNDYPHSSFAKPMIFQDYYDWFTKTLMVAKRRCFIWLPLLLPRTLPRSKKARLI